METVRCVHHGVLMTRRYSTSSWQPTGDPICHVCEEHQRRREASIDVCRRCGKPWQEHVAYHGPAPADAQVGDFGNAWKGLYCRDA